MSLYVQLLDLAAHCATLSKTNTLNYTLHLTKKQFKQLTVVTTENPFNGNPTTWVDNETSFETVFAQCISQGTVPINPPLKIVLSFVQKKYVCCQEVECLVNVNFNLESLSCTQTSVIFNLTYVLDDNLPNADKYLCTRCLYFVNIALQLFTTMTFTNDGDQNGDDVPQFAQILNYFNNRQYISNN